MDSDQVSKLSTLYKHIKAATFEAEWYRRRREEYESLIDVDKYKKNNFVGKRLNELGDAQVRRLKELRTEIDKIFQEKWWTYQEASKGKNLKPQQTQ